MLQQDDNVYDRSLDRFGVLEQHNPEHRTWTVIYSGDGEPTAVRNIAESQLDLVCPFCPNSTVDADWRACPTCKEII